MRGVDDGRIITLRVALTSAGDPRDKPICKTEGESVATNSATLTMTTNGTLTISIGCTRCRGDDAAAWSFRPVMSLFLHGDPLGNTPM